MLPNDLILNSKDCSDMELYLISNLEKITSSRHLLELLKQYLDETNEAKRQVLSSQIIQSIESKE